MKNLITFGLILMTLMSTAAISHAQDRKGQSLRHVVMFKFKDSSQPSEVARVEQAFASLSKKIPLIKDFEWGTNNSPENLNQGLTHCFLVTFRSEKDRDEYLVHPEHQKFVEIVKPHLDKVTVLDYWAK